MPHVVYCVLPCFYRDLCLKPTGATTPSALPELSLPISEASPSDLGTVVEMTMSSSLPSPLSGSRNEEGKYY